MLRDLVQRVKRSVAWVRGRPSNSAAARNPTAWAMAIPISTPTAFCAEVVPMSAASSTRPRTSSTTAAPRIRVAPRLELAPSSSSTAAVTPMLVAVSVAPMKSAGSGAMPKALAPSVPSSRGTTIPTSARTAAGRATWRTFSSSVSSPTRNSRTHSPIWARPKRGSPSAPWPGSSTTPRREGPRSTPATISPTTAGRPQRRATAPRSFAETRTMGRSQWSCTAVPTSAYGAGASRYPATAQEASSSAPQRAARGQIRGYAPQ